MIRPIGLALVCGLAAALSPAVFAQDVIDLIDRQPPAAPPPDQPEPTAEPAPPPPGPAGEVVPADEGPTYRVTGFTLLYGRTEAAERPDLTDATFRDLRVRLSRDGAGYTAPRRDRPTIDLRLSEISDANPGEFHRSAIEEVCRAIVREFNRRGIYALFISPSEEDIDERAWAEGTGASDLRQGRTTLVIKVWTGVVQNVRTVASGERNLGEPAVNNAAHRLTLRNSPVQPGQLLYKDQVDDYAYALNRHPGRRIDAAISAADDAGGVQLDYLVTENKPWTVYLQLSNTGTKNTSDWRERVGFIHNQLSDNDDIFRIEYATAGFDSSHAVSPSYEFPILTNVLRAKVYGSWSQFTASDVGLQQDEFKGTNLTAGAELAWTVAQFRNTFIDAVGGVRFEKVKIEKRAFFGGEGDEQFFLPYVGARLERNTDSWRTFAQLTYEFTVGDAERAEVDLLGRPGAATSWGVLRWDVDHSMYIEPLFDPTDPAYQTLAHEVALSFRGQYGFDHELIPTAQGVVGGLYSVRGYPESVVAGDTVYVGSAEYRFHVPHALGTSTKPGTLLGEDFRWKPQGPYGRADWDLVLKAFIDAGQAEINNKIPVQTDETLVGAGVGVELQVRRNFNLRLDWGFALEEINKNPQAGGQFVSSGSNRVHISATLAF